MIEFNLHFLEALKSDHRGGMEENKVCCSGTLRMHTTFFSSEENAAKALGRADRFERKKGGYLHVKGLLRFSTL